MITDFCEHFNLHEDPFVRETFHPAAAHMALLDELEHALQFGESALVLTGGAGVGKSTLLRVLAGRLNGEVFIITAEDFASLDLLLLTLCEELLLPVNDGMSIREMEALIGGLAREQDPSAAPVIMIDRSEALPQGAMLSLLRLAAADNSRVAIRLLLVCPEGFASDLPAAIFAVPQLPLAESVDLLNTCMREAGYQGEDVFRPKQVEPWWHQAEGNLKVLQNLARQWLIDLAASNQEPAGVSRAFSVAKLTPVPLAHMVTVAALVAVLGTVFLYRSDSGSQAVTTSTVSIPERQVTPVITEPDPAPIINPVKERRTEEHQLALTPPPVPVLEEPPVQAAPPDPAPDNTTPTAPSAPKVNTSAASAVEPSQPLRPAASRLGEDEQLLLSWPASTYTIQVLAVATRSSAQAFVERHSGTPMLVLETERSGKPWYVVVTGRYNSADLARIALRNLPEDVKEAKPWPRKVGELQQKLGAATASS